MQQNRIYIMTLLRWLAIVPAAVLGSIIVIFLWRLIFVLASKSFESDINQELIISLFSGSSFVYCGLYLSPFYKKYVAFFLASFVISVCVFHPLESRHEYFYHFFYLETMAEKICQCIGATIGIGYAYSSAIGERIPVSN